MSWDAVFDGQSWNYTHNINAMVAAAYESVSGEPTPPLEDHPLAKAIGPTWFKRLHGMTGEQGAEYLGQIIKGLRSDPARFRAMDPPNGWGDYDGLLRVLCEMKEAGDNACCDVRRWWVNG